MAWVCTRCTYFNAGVDALGVRCGTCGGSKPSLPGQPKAKFAHVVASESDSDSDNNKRHALREQPTKKRRLHKAGDDDRTRGKTATTSASLARRRLSVGDSDSGDGDSDASDRMRTKDGSARKKATKFIPKIPQGRVRHDDDTSSNDGDTDDDSEESSDGKGRKRRPAARRPEPKPAAGAAQGGKAGKASGKNALASSSTQPQLTFKGPTLTFKGSSAPLGGPSKPLSTGPLTRPVSAPQSVPVGSSGTGGVTSKPTSASGSVNTNSNNVRAAAGGKPHAAVSAGADVIELSDSDDDDDDIDAQAPDLGIASVRPLLGPGAAGRAQLVASKARPLAPVTADRPTARLPAAAAWHAASPSRRAPLSPAAPAAVARPAAPLPAAPRAASAPAPPAGLDLPWADKYAPASAGELVVHVKKLGEVRAWLRGARQASLAGRGLLPGDDLGPTDPYSMGLQPHPRLLILMGPPGTGKSTAARLLATETGFQSVRTWADTGGRTGTGSNAAQTAARGGGGRKWASRGSGNGDDDDDRGSSGGDGGWRGGGGSGGDINALLQRMYESGAGGGSGGRGWDGVYVPGGTVLADFRTFLGASTSFPSLKFKPAATSLRQQPSGSRSAAPAASASSSSSSSGDGGGPQCDLLLLEDVPRASHGGSDDAGFRREVGRALTSFLASSAFPAVLIASEGEAPGDAATRPSLVRLLGREVVEHPSTAVIAVNPVADTAMRRVLTGALRAERVPPTAVSSRDLDGVIASAHGDLRHALTTLQFLVTAPHLVVHAAPALAAPAPRGQGRKRGKAAAAFEDDDEGADNHASAAASAAAWKRTTTGKLKASARDIAGDAGDAHAGSSVSPSASSRLCGRDDFFDALHTLGKLLYAKREGPEAGSVSPGRLLNDPDTLMAGCPYDAATTCAFIAHNGVHFFTDVGQLSRAWDVLSSADVLLSHGNGGGRGGRSHRGGGAASVGSGVVYPEHTAAALVARAMSTHNAHPASRSFRPLTKPSLFAVARVADSNGRWLREEGLGASTGAADVGVVAATAAAASAPGHLLAVPSLSERTTVVLPAMGALLQAHTARKARGAAAASAAVDGSALGLSQRLAALCLASCSFGRCSKGGAEPCTTIGQTATALLAAPGGGGAGLAGGGGGQGDDEGADGLTRREDSDNEDSGEAAMESAAALEEPTAMQPLTAVEQDAAASAAAGPSAPVSFLSARRQRELLSSLQVGQWEATAAAAGVDVFRPPPGSGVAVTALFGGTGGGRGAHMNTASSEAAAMRHAPMRAPVAATAGAGADNAYEDDIEE